MLKDLRKLNTEMFATGGMGIGSENQPPAMYFTNQIKNTTDQLDELLARGAPKEDVEAKLGEINLSVDLLAARLGCELEDCLRKGFKRRAERHHFAKELPT